MRQPDRRLHGPPEASCEWPGRRLSGDPHRVAPCPSPCTAAIGPGTFAEVIGQDHVTAPLQQALRSDQVNHAYLFSGPRGCGKTTPRPHPGPHPQLRAGHRRPTPRAACASRASSWRAAARAASTSSRSTRPATVASTTPRDLRERASFAPRATATRSSSSTRPTWSRTRASTRCSRSSRSRRRTSSSSSRRRSRTRSCRPSARARTTTPSASSRPGARRLPPALCSQEGVTVDDAASALVVRAGAGSVRDSLSVLDQLVAGQR